MGDINFENQVSHKYWTVGQWQDGVFRGVASSNMDGAGDRAKATELKRQSWCGRASATVPTPQCSKTVQQKEQRKRVS